MTLQHLPCISVVALRVPQGHKMARFTVILMLSLLFQLEVVESCEIVPNVECTVGESLTERLLDTLSHACVTCLCIEYKEATAAQCCSSAPVPTGYDGATCEIKLDEEECIYVVREIKTPHKLCDFKGYVMK
ncbi:beta-microseminoprotein-like [Acanthaster planci]|uniref:Beta-microseminoprotein-like n=1 Tax=Acanthaster planci TaxID=133434 RepID=A0A8B7YDS2_ACAPL|nr:beta-microseminoprotein-like [Acanthaster planci]